MSTGDLLNVDPIELKFPFELKKQISCSLQLSNKTENHVAFKVKTTNPKKYCVRPNTGVVLPRSTCDVTGKLQLVPGGWPSSGYDRKPMEARFEPETSPRGESCAYHYITP